jgi:hypothetical protein
MAALGSPATLDERHSRALLPERQVISGLVGNQLWRGPRLRTGAKTQNDTVNVGMQEQVLSPGVQDRDHTDLGS